MWSIRIPQDVHVDKNNWSSICNYWETEIQQFLTDDIYTVNDLLFDIFCSMLSEQGVQDESEPFNLGYVSTKFLTQYWPSSHYINQVFSILQNNCICYVARNSECYFPIEITYSKD